MFHEKGVQKIHKKILILESLFNKETLLQVFWCKNAYFAEHLRMAASVDAYNCIVSKLFLGV